MLTTFTDAIASWVVVDKATHTAVLETFSERVAAAINRVKYDVVPIEDYLISINGKAKGLVKC